MIIEHACTFAPPRFKSGINRVVERRRCPICGIYNITTWYPNGSYSRQKQMLWWPNFKHRKWVRQMRKEMTT